MLTSQTEICLPSHNYSESRYQVKKIKQYQFKMSRSELGIPYLNPCISEIEIASDGDSLKIYCELLEKTRSQNIDIHLMRRKKGVLQYFTKFKKLESISYIGEFDTKSSFYCNIPKAETFILLFINKSNINDHVVLEFGK